MSNIPFASPAALLASLKADADGWTDPRWTESTLDEDFNEACLAYARDNVWNARHWRINPVLSTPMSPEDALYWAEAELDREERLSA